MRVLIDTSGVQVRVSGVAKMRPDFKDKERQGDDPGRRADLDRAPGRDRPPPRDQGDHLGRRGWRTAQADLR